MDLASGGMILHTKWYHGMSSVPCPLDIGRLAGRFATRAGSLDRPAAARDDSLRGVHYCSMRRNRKAAPRKVTAMPMHNASRLGA